MSEEIDSSTGNSAERVEENDHPESELDAFDVTESGTDGAEKDAAIDLMPETDITELGHDVSDDEEQIDTAGHQECNEEYEDEVTVKHGKNKKKEKSSDYYGDEDFRRRIILLNMIRQYCVKCKAVSDMISYEDIVKIKDNGKLEQVLETIRLSASASNTQEAIVSAYYAGTEVLEKVASHAGFKIRGFSGLIRGSSQIRSTLDEVSIEYGSTTYVDPLVRLAGLTLVAAYGMHKKNAAYEEVNGCDKEISETTATEYADL